MSGRSDHSTQDDANWATNFSNNASDQIPGSMSNAEFDVLVNTYTNAIASSDHSRNFNDPTMAALPYDPPSMDTLLSRDRATYDVPRGQSLSGVQSSSLPPTDTSAHMSLQSVSAYQEKNLFTVAKTAASVATSALKVPSSATEASATGAAAAAAAAAAVLQANGLMNPLNQEADSAGVGGFDWNRHFLAAQTAIGLRNSGLRRSGAVSGLNNLPSNAHLGQGQMYMPSAGQIFGRASWGGALSGPFADAQSLIDGGNTSQEAQAEDFAWLTPGTESSDNGGNTSSCSTKRRRMTFSGPDSTHQSGRGRPSGHGTLVPMAQQSNQRQSFCQGFEFSAQGSGSSSSSFPGDHWERAGSSHLVNPRQLEAMAQESLQRANAENNRSIDVSGHLSALPLTCGELQQQQQQQSVQVSPRPRSSTSGAPLKSAPDTTSRRFYGSQCPAQASSSQGIGPASRALNNSTSAAFDEANAPAGAAASHPPSLGPSILRGQDPASSGCAAANDFTRRKGWATRVVDELLDFSHVLDVDGKILYATNSVLALTGWKPEQLKGRSILDFAHPQDAFILQRDLNRGLQDKSDILLYYRFKRNPSMLAARAKARFQENEAGSKSRKGRTRSGSGSLSSPTDTSSVPTSTSGESNDLVKPHPSTIGEVDPDAEWVTLEMSGHAYFPPVAVDEEKDGDTEPKEQQGCSTSATATGTIKEEPSSAALTGQGTFGQGEAVKAVEPPGSITTSTRQQMFKLPLARLSKAQCFFCASRIYPSKSVMVLDSFLELKVENEKLRQQLEDLNLNFGRDSAADEGSNGQSWSGAQAASDEVQRRQSDSHVDVASSDENEFRKHFGSYGESSGMLPPSHNLSRPGLSMIQPASIGLMRSMTNASSTSTTAETSTHERSFAGSPQSNDHSAFGDFRTLSSAAKKKKKPSQSLSSRTESLAAESVMAASASSGNLGASHNASTANAGDEDRVCTDCGRTDSPEWRKGPLGPKTLCNACGLRYAKKMKRRSQPPSVGPSNGVLQASAVGAAGHGLSDAPLNTPGVSAVRPVGYELAGSPLQPQNLLGPQNQRFQQQQQEQQQKLIRSQMPMQRPGLPHQMSAQDVHSGLGAKPSFTTMNSFAPSKNDLNSRFGLDRSPNQQGEAGQRRQSILGGLSMPPSQSSHFSMVSPLGGFGGGASMSKGPNSGVGGMQHVQHQGMYVQQPPGMGFGGGSVCMSQQPSQQNSNYGQNPFGNFQSLTSSSGVGQMHMVNEGQQGQPPRNGHSLSHFMGPHHLQ